MKVCKRIAAFIILAVVLILCFVLPDYYFRYKDKSELNKVGMIESENSLILTEKISEASFEYKIARVRSDDRMVDVNNDKEEQAKILTWFQKKLVKVSEKYGLVDDKESIEKKLIDKDIRSVIYMNEDDNISSFAAHIVCYKWDGYVINAVIDAKTQDILKLEIDVKNVYENLEALLGSQSGSTSSDKNYIDMDDLYPIIEAVLYEIYDGYSIEYTGLEKNVYDNVSSDGVIDGYDAVIGYGDDNGGGEYIYSYSIINSNNEKAVLKVTIGDGKVTINGK